MLLLTSCTTMLLVQAVQRAMLHKRGTKRKKNGAIPLSAAAIREHNVKCQSGSVSSAAPVTGKKPREEQEVRGGTE